jgi:hypothetical protein
MNVIGRHYPLVSALTPFWFGPFRDIPSNWWNQTEAPAFSGIDVGRAFSWQSISVPGNDFSCLSVTFQSGNHYAGRPGGKFQISLGVWFVLSQVLRLEEIDIRIQIVYSMERKFQTPLRS